MTEGEHTSGLVTVVFVDVEGSTALVDDLGDEAGVALVTRQLDVLRERIEPYGGREVKSLGDGLLLAFASPRSAVAFALASQRALSDGGPRVRFGVNTGEVLHAHDDVAGAAVNAAARIAARAAGGEVLVSAVVRQLVGNAPAVRFTDRGRCRLKGFTERWHLYEAVDATASAASEVTVGRVDVLAAIEELVGSVPQRGGSLVLEGEAGIGKSHLVRRAVELARSRGLRVIECATDELERRPGAVVHGLADAADDGAVRQALLEQLSPREDIDGSDRGFPICEAAVDLMEAMASPDGALLVAEDLHWADDLSLRAVAAIARRAPSSQIAVLLTCRPSPRPALLGRLLERLADGGATLTRLAALTTQDVHALAAATLGAVPGPTLCDRLLAASGNPLYACELLSSMEDENTLRIDAGVAELTHSDMPADLRRTLLRRVSWVDEEVVELLRIASILGGSFTLRDLATVTGRSVIDIAARLHEASLARLVVGAGDRLAFRHDLIREAIYEDMAPAVRRDLHRAAGGALADARAPLAQVATQVALGARPGDMDAVGWLERAAKECVSRDPGAAVDLLERGVALAPVGTVDRTRLEVQLIEPYARTGRFDDGEAIATQVLDGPADEQIRIDALRGLAAIHGTRGRIDEAIVALHAAADAAPSENSIGRCLRLVATQIALTSGIGGDAERSAVRAALADAERDADAPLACLAHQALGFVHALEGNDDAALHHFETATSMLTTGRTPWTAYLAPDGYVGATLAALDRLDDAREVGEAVRARAERQAALTDLPFAYLVTGVASLFSGCLDAAAVELEAGRSVAEDAGAGNFALYLDAALAEVALRRGDLAVAERLLASGAAWLGAGRSKFGADWLFDAQAELLAARGDHAAALVVRETLWAQKEPVRYFFGFRIQAVRLARLAHQQGRRDLADEVVAALDEAAGRTSARSVAAAAKRARGIVEGRLELLEEAIALLRTTPLRPELADCCQDAAALHVAQGRPADAVRLLEEAAAFYLEVGALADLARAETVLQRLGRRRSSRPARATIGWDALTTMERRVVELVAEGLTNPQVGARLFISRRTVETHLSHVFAKVGLSSRTQVAAEHARRSV